jgi:hypothetical protein
MAAATVVYEEHFDGDAGKWLVGDLGWSYNGNPGYGGIDLQVTNDTSLSSPAIDGSTAPGGTAVYKQFTRIPTATGYVITGNMDAQRYNSMFGFTTGTGYEVVWNTVTILNKWRFAPPGLVSYDYDMTGYTGIVGLEIAVDEVNNLTRGKIYKSGLTPIDTGWHVYGGAPVSAVFVGSYAYTANDVDDIVVTAVPEPSSILPLVGGLGCVIASLRRRRS